MSSNRTITDLSCSRRLFRLTTPLGWLLSRSDSGLIDAESLLTVEPIQRDCPNQENKARTMMLSDTARIAAIGSRTRPRSNRRSGEKSGEYAKMRVFDWIRGRVLNLTCITPINNRSLGYLSLSILGILLGYFAPVKVSIAFAANRSFLRGG